MSMPPRSALDLLATIGRNSRGGAVGRRGGGGGVDGNIRAADRPQGDVLGELAGVPAAPHRSMEDTRPERLVNMKWGVKCAKKERQKAKAEKSRDLSGKAHNGGKARGIDAATSGYW